MSPWINIKRKPCGKIIKKHTTGNSLKVPRHGLILKGNHEMSSKDGSLKAPFKTDTS